MVDLVGIEPTTSSMPWKRAPSCATGPLRGRNAARVDGVSLIFSQQHSLVKQLPVVCSCSKIMSPHNCNETLSPCKDGDHESERVPTGESDRECSGREAERTRSLPPAAIE